MADEGSTLQDTRQI